jgi:hypothetical protein
MYCPDFAIFGYKQPAPPKENAAVAAPPPAAEIKEDQDAR